MPVAVLAGLKLVLLVLLYLFVLRAVRAVVVDLYGPRRRKTAPPPRPAVASSPKKSRKPPRQLVVHAPEGKPLVVPLAGQPVTFGRSRRATVQVQDVYASDEHVVIAPDGEGWVVRDLGSTNGTYLNGARVTAATALTSGDQVRIGKTRIEARR